MMAELAIVFCEYMEVFEGLVRKQCEENADFFSHLSYNLKQKMLKLRDKQVKTLKDKEALD